MVSLLFLLFLELTNDFFFIYEVLENNNNTIFIFLSKYSGFKN